MDAPSPTKQLQILFVDDDQALAESCGELLDTFGYATKLAYNGLQAIELLNKSSFDLVITDILMPDKEGLELIIEIQQKFPTLPVVAISGGGKIGADNYLNMAVKLGCKAALPKPFTAQQLDDAISLAVASK